MAESVQMSMAEAVAQHVRPGMTIAMGTCLEALIPFAFGHELIRQGARDLVLVGPISDLLFDELIGAGCVAGVRAAWVGNVSAGLGHNYRRACEEGVPRALEVHEYSNFTVALALWAGAVGSPYVPTRTLLGSDIPATNPDLVPGEWEGSPVLRVRALRPDLTVLHVQRASPDGLAHAWGNLGIAQEAALAARGVVLVAERVLPRERLLSDPNRILLPPHKVVGVVEEPGGAHPSPVQGHYNRDHAWYSECHAASRDRAGFEGWLERWVLSVPDRTTYLARLGERWTALAARSPALAAEVDYGS